MSSQAVAWAIVHTAGGMSAKVVLLSIANYANEYGECWAAQATLAKGAECSVRQLRRVLTDLEARGLIERERRGGAGKGRDTDMIRLRMRELPAILSAQERRKEQPDKLAASPPDRLSLSPPDKLAASHSNRTPCPGGNRTNRGGQPDIAMSDNPKNPRKNPPYPPGFEEVWAMWPKHVRASSKQEAARRLSRLNVQAFEIVAAATAYLRSPDAVKENRSFVPALEVWLNKRAEFWLEHGARPDPTELDRRRRLYAHNGTWRDEWGPRPTDIAAGASS